MLSNLFLMALVPAVLGLPTSAPSPALPSNDTDTDIIPGKYIITLKPGVNVADMVDHVNWARGVHSRSLRRRDEDGGVDKVWTGVFKGYTGEFDPETVAEIEQSDKVAAVEPVRVVETYQTITQSNSPWGLSSISHRQPGYTDYPYDSRAGKDSWVYVVDTGVNVNHVEFEGRAVLGYNAFPSSAFVDTMGHGTHCAGIAASKTYGVAKKANIMAVKVFDNGGSTTDVVIDGYLWAVNNITNTPNRASKAVVSLSLGGGRSDAFNDAVEKAYRKGVLTVVAAGNSGADANDTSPASAPNAITVGAIDINNVKPDFSNFGTVLDIFAAGVDIPSTWIDSDTSVAYLSGTSMATPHVAGLAAYLISKEGIKKPAELTTRIKNLGTKNVLTNIGTGSPNLLAFNGAE